MKYFIVHGSDGSISLIAAKSLERAGFLAECNEDYVRELYELKETTAVVEGYLLTQYIDVYTSSPLQTVSEHYPN